jgi:Fic family protein
MSFIATQPYDLKGLPPENLNLTDSIHKWLLKARIELAELKGYSTNLPNPMLLLSPAILKEALASSEIENINTTIERVLQQQLFPEAEQKMENKEVLRYKEAVDYGFGNLGTLSLSNRLIREIHKILLSERSYGYRKFQNQIENSSSKEVIYTPPSPDQIDLLIANWESYVHDEGDDLDPLIKCAISYYQFEAIHPFNDGNGRTGRILMVLYLVYKEILNFPILFVSGYINKNRTEYYRLLRNITDEQDWTSFIEYMLKSFYYQAKETKEQLFKVMATFYETKNRMKEDCPSSYSSDLAEIMFSTPIITPIRLGNLMDIHYTTATRYLKDLKNNQFLEHQKLGKYQIYINKKLLDILNG